MRASGWPYERTVEKSSCGRARRAAILTGANVRGCGSSRRQSLVSPLQDVSPPPPVARGAELSRCKRVKRRGNPLLILKQTTASHRLFEPTVARALKQ